MEREREGKEKIAPRMKERYINKERGKKGRERWIKCRNANFF